VEDQQRLVLDYFALGKDEVVNETQGGGEEGNLRKEETDISAQGEPPLTPGRNIHTSI